jgi:hypothetical protein
MDTYLYFIIGLVVGGVFVWWVLSRGKADSVVGGSSAGESEEGGEKEGFWRGFVKMSQ